MFIVDKLSTEVPINANDTVHDSYTPFDRPSKILLMISKLLHVTQVVSGSTSPLVNELRYCM